MNYLFGLISIVSFFVILSTKIDENQKAQSLSQLVIRLILWNSIVVIASLAIYVFFIGDSGAGSGYAAIEKKLNITIKDNNPCFYIEPFEEIGAFNLYKVHVIKPPMPYERYWRATLYDKTMIAIPLSSFVNTEECIPYGVKNHSFSAPSKELQRDVLYEASIDASRNNIPKGKEEEDRNRLTANVWFYLSKSPETSELRAIELNKSQVNDWMKKMNEHNKSIETTK